MSGALVSLASGALVTASGGHGSPHVRCDASTFYHRDQADTQQ